MCVCACLCVCISMCACVHTHTHCILRSRRAHTHGDKGTAPATRRNKEFGMLSPSSPVTIHVEMHNDFECITRRLVAY